MESFFFAVPVVYALKNANHSVKANSNKRFHPIKLFLRWAKFRLINFGPIARE